MLPPSTRRAVARTLLSDPLVNRGMAWPAHARDAFGLRGLLPPRFLTIEQQLLRVRRNFDELSSPLAKFKYLSDLQDRNETLFYRFVIDNTSEMLPYIYTPTVGEVCQKFGHIFRRPRGLYVSYEDRGQIKNVLDNWGGDPRVIVVTDGERILGLGDLGANGMGIPVGKLSLYVACAGLDPRHTLPICLDVGTNRDELRSDPLYPGLAQPRVRGDAYQAFVDEFVEAVHLRWPHVLLQWEDFGVDNAFVLLERHRGNICSFNDDIQGTATVVLAALFGACRITRPLEEQRYLFYGAGSSAVGVGDLISGAIAKKLGCSIEEARKKCFFCDTEGLLTASRLPKRGGRGVKAHKTIFCHDIPPTTGTTLEEAVDAVKPTALIGLSTQPKSFTKEIVTKMAEYNERPIIFALSNPTSKAECTAEEAYTWTDGRALFATGSPFDDVVYKGKTHVSSQANNAYIFPGVGLGVTLAMAKSVPDEFFHTAAEECAKGVTDRDLNTGALLPQLDDIREVSARIATAVIKKAIELGIAGRQSFPGDIGQWVRSRQYYPRYTDSPVF